MKLKTYLTILFLIVMLIILTISIVSNIKLKNENARISDNMEQYERSISTLVLTNQEINSELNRSEYELTNTSIALARADSLLLIKNRRISQLEILVNTTVKIRDVDTSYLELTLQPTVEKPDTLYKHLFKHSKSCITVSGFIFTTDPYPSLAITERSADIEVYDIRIHRKWYQFWRPREERFLETNCGDVKILTVYKKK